MLGVFAEFETNLRKERQLEGIAKAKAAGVYNGRKPSVDVSQVRARMRASASRPKFPPVMVRIFFSHFPWRCRADSLGRNATWMDGQHDVPQ